MYTQPRAELNGADVDIDRSSGFQGGLLLPGTLFGHRVAFSLGLFLPDDRITRLRALRQSQPRFELYDNRPHRLVITSSASVQIVDDLFFGAGVTYLSNTEGKLDVEGVVHTSDVSKTRLLSSVNVNLRAVRYPSFGLMWRPGAHWRFGLAERESFSLALDLDVDVHGRIVAGPTNTTVVEEGRFFLTSVNDNLFSPRQVVGGRDARGQHQAGGEAHRLPLGEHGARHGGNEGGSGTSTMSRISAPCWIVRERPDWSGYR